MVKRTIKPAAAESHITASDAKAAARVVYRNSATGKFVVAKRQSPIGAARQQAASSTTGRAKLR
jgi:hypothetical protein